MVILLVINSVLWVCVYVMCVLILWQANGVFSTCSLAPFDILVNCSVFVYRWGVSGECERCSYCHGMKFVLHTTQSTFVRVGTNDWNSVETDLVRQFKHFGLIFRQLSSKNPFQLRIDVGQCSEREINRQLWNKCMQWLHSMLEWQCLSWDESNYFELNIRYWDEWTSKCPGLMGLS